MESALKADIIFNNKIIEHVSGTPQGGILSPLLSNIYLHELDQFMEEIMKEYQGTSSLSYPYPRRLSSRGGLEGGSLHPQLRGPIQLRRGLEGGEGMKSDLGSYPPFSF